MLERSCLTRDPYRYSYSAYQHPLGGVYTSLGTSRHVFMKIKKDLSVVFGQVICFKVGTCSYIENKCSSKSTCS